MLQKASHITGITNDQAQARLSKKEKISFPFRSNYSYWQIIQSNIFNLYNVILILSSILILLLRGNTDVLIAVGLVFANISVGLFQEIRAKKILDDLATLNIRSVHVRRDKESVVIPLAQLVEGDVIEIFPGEPIVADGVIIFSDSLEMDESSLTGESESIAKVTNDQITSGSFCLTGFGLMRALKVSSKSSLYELTKKAKDFRTSQTDSEKRLKKLFQFLLYAILLLGPLTLISGINQGFSLPQALTNVVNLVSSLIPQGMILSMTILFAYGAISISRFQTLIQRNNSIAIMGAITVLCADKTGTLTTNQLSLEKIVPLGHLSAAKINDKLIQFTHEVSWANKTIQAIASFLSPEQKEGQNFAEKKSEIPFTSEQKWGSVSFESETLVLGAPEVLTTDTQILEQVTALAQKGFRVLLFGQYSHPLSHSNALPSDLTILALLTFHDQLRTGVKETCATLAQQHIQLKIISGDNSETLRSIANQIQIPCTYLYSQSDLEEADEDQFGILVKQGQFFARITPVMKEKIITQLVNQGEIVAMIGDGINDVRALKKSHVSIAVNDGAQITKDIADIILLNNNFATLPKAIREGRDITQRVYAVAKIFFVKVIYLITLFLFAGFASFAFPISIRQTSWLGFIVVGVPTALIAFKVLNPSPTKNLEKGLIRFTLTAGILGGMFMALIMIVTQLLLQEDLETSRTQVSLFASLYTMFVLLQVHGISIFSVKSIQRNFNSFILILLIGIIAVIFPGALTPGIFQSAHLDYLDWLVIAFSIAGSVVVLRYLLRKILLVQLLKRIFT